MSSLYERERERETERKKERKTERQKSLSHCTVLHVITIHKYLDLEEYDWE